VSLKSYFEPIQYLSVPHPAERARLLSRHQAVLAQHKVQGVDWRRRRARRIVRQRAHAGEAVLRHHVQATQGRRRSHRAGQQHYRDYSLVELWQTD